LIDKNSDGGAILILPPWYPAAEGQYGGIFIRTQALALSRRRDVVVLYIRLRALRDIRKRKIPLLPRLRIKTRGRLREIALEIVNLFPGILPLRSIYLTTLYRALFELLVRPFSRITSIHAHAINDAGFAARRLAGRGIPYYITEHSSSYMDDKHFDPLLRIRMRRCAKEAKAILAVSRALGDKIGEKLGISTTDIQVIPNMVDPVFFSFVTRKIAFDAPKLLAVCNLVPVKGLEYLIDAVALLVPEFPGIVLRIAGKGHLQNSLECRARALGISLRVIFEGAVPRGQVRDLMLASDILVVSSFTETFGVVLIEAMATGMPVVATRCGGPDDIVRPEDGELVAPGSAEALAEGIRHVISRYESFRADDIRRRCIDFFGEEHTVDSLLALYDREERL
jgi:glycosyltransferase involved in cell wall biosynthesis